MWRCGGVLQPKKGGIKETQGYDIQSVEIKSETGYLLVDVNNDKISPQWIHVYDKNVSANPNDFKRKIKRN